MEYAFVAFVGLVWLTVAGASLMLVGAMAWYRSTSRRLADAADRPCDAPDVHPH